MQNGASLLEAAEILTNDNFNILKQKLLNEVSSMSEYEFETDCNHAHSRHG